jgi:maleylacetoacetate isomerase
MKLHTWFRSSAAFRVRIALNLKGLAYDMTPVALPRAGHREPGYVALNPQALVPTLEVDGLQLTQSLAILEYLEEKHPKPALLPADPAGRARVRSLALLIACEIHPLNNLRALSYVKKSLGQSEASATAWYHHWIADGFQKLEAELLRAGTGRYCHGDTPTMADCCLVPQVFNAQRYKCDLAPYTTAMRVFAECMKHEAFDRAQPSKQPEAATES